MAVDKHDALIRKLKQEVKRLQQREEKAKREVKVALKKARKLSQTYKSKLVKEARAMKHKLADVQAAAYLKAAADLETWLVKKVKARLEKSEFARLVKCVLREGVKGKKRGKK